GPGRTPGTATRKVAAEPGPGAASLAADRPSRRAADMAGGGGGETRDASSRPATGTESSVRDREIPPGTGNEPTAAPRSASALVDWSAALSAMKLSGMARQLAQHCELMGESDGVVDLRLAEAQKHLLEKGPQERLRAAMES